MAVDAEDPPELDVKDFRLWWEQGSPYKATEGRSNWKLSATMLMLVGLTSILALALRGDGTRPPKEAPTVAVNGNAARRSPGGESTVAPNDVAPFRSSLGLLAAPPTARSPDIKPVRTVTVRPDGSPIATPVSTDSSVSTDAPRPPTVSEPEATKDAVRIERAVKSGSPAKHPPARPPSRAVVAPRDATGPMALGPGVQVTLLETSRQG